MVQQSSWRCHDHVYSFGELERLLFLVGAANDKRRGSLAELGQFLQDVEGLLGELSHRGNYDHSNSHFLRELFLIKRLKRRY